jgi:hypothetical protein
VHRIGKTITYAQLAARGILEFDQTSAFRRLSFEVPEWRHEIATIERLAPFYQQTRSRSSSQEFPFDPNGPEAKSNFLEAYRAVTVLAGQGGASA